MRRRGRDAPRTLAPAAEAAIRSAIGSISGVSIRSLEERPDTASGPRLDIQIEGWSPSLNRLPMTWTTGIPDAPAADQAESMLTSLGLAIAIQKERLAQGLTLGTASPFGIASMDGYSRDDTRWDHILIDRGLAALMEASRQGGFASEVSNSVFDMHQPDQGPRNGRETSLEGRTTDDDCKPIGRCQLRGRTLHHDVPLGGGAVYDGLRLTLGTQIPETLLTAAIGRTLGEVVEVPAAIAGHVVTGGDTGPGRTEITVEPRLAACGVLLAEIAGEGLTTG